MNEGCVHTCTHVANDPPRLYNRRGTSKHVYSGNLHTCTSRTHVHVCMNVCTVVEGTCTGMCTYMYVHVM